MAEYFILTNVGYPLDKSLLKHVAQQVPSLTHIDEKRVHAQSCMCYFLYNYILFLPHCFLKLFEFTKALKDDVEMVYNPL